MASVYGCVLPEGSKSLDLTCTSTALKTLCNKPFNRLNEKCSKSLQRGQDNLFLKTYSDEDHQKEFEKLKRCKNEFYQERVKPCEIIAREKCSTASIIAYKSLRMKMEELTGILENDPDTQVVYLVRDPRSIVASRFNMGLVYDGAYSDPALEAKYLCLKMLEDLKHFKILKDGMYRESLKIIRYEDLVLHTQETIADIYRFLDYPIHPSIQRLINLTHSYTERYFDKWRTVFTSSKQKQMNDVCKDLIVQLKYPLS